MNKGKRRSDRILLSIPLRVQGRDGKKKTFEATARTLVLSRYGARIRVNRPLHRGQSIRITNVTARSAADFRVIGALTPFSADGGEYGVEYLNQEDDIWGIHFPPLQAGETSKSKALLECRNCRSVQLLPLSPIEVEVLQTSGILVKTCEQCQISGPCSRFDQPVVAAGQGPLTAGRRDGAFPEAKAVRQVARHRRVALRLPVRIRDYAGGVEITQCENISKGGLSFTSEREYHIGEGLMVTCPYQHLGENIEVRARVANAQARAGSSCRIYGIRFVL